MEEKVYLLNAFAAVPGCPNEHPYEGAARSGAPLPAGWPIRSSIFVVDKVDVVFCDGNDNWYREADKPVAAGQPISSLF